jgi:predicted GIY-YIG superfamily endonuclease
VGSPSGSPLTLYRGRVTDLNGKEERSRLFSIDELIEKRLLKIPETDDVLTVEDLQNGCRFKDRGGVYIFYNRHDEPLYVGISYSLYKRVPEHLGSRKGNKDLIQYIKHKKGVYVAIFYEDDKAYQELYESYLIKVLNPRFNVSKTGRQKV